MFKLFVFANRHARQNKMASLDLIRSEIEHARAGKRSEEISSSRAGILTLRQSPPSADARQD
jgi:hypothetical protein